MPLPIPEPLAGKLGAARNIGNQWMVRCPAHADGTASLAVMPQDTGRVLLTCHAGCGVRDVLDAVGLTWAAVMPPDDGSWKDADNGLWTPAGQASEVYRYCDEGGGLAYEVLRIPQGDGRKEFRQRRPDPAAPGRWVWNLKDVRRLPYRLPELLRGLRDGEEIIVCEGEKDVNTAVARGRVATCNSSGAKKFTADHAEWFKGFEASVVVVADADEPGREHARIVKALLEGVGAKVRIAEPAHGCKDLTDHFDAGHGWDGLRVMGEHRSGGAGVDLVDLLGRPVAEYNWLVPGLLERGDRFMLTGPEGLGKTTLLRQIAVCIALGVHPFLFHRTEPRKVLWVDCENSEDQSRRNFGWIARIAAQVGTPVERGQMLFHFRTDGLELNRVEDAEWLMERVLMDSPDVLVIGPWYHLHSGSPNDEELGRKVIKAIDHARTQVGCAVIMEAHSPHAAQDSKRPVRPIGSSILLRWPEFGYGLRFPDDADPDHCDFVPWRGARDVRDWPTALRRGGEGAWPWVPCDEHAKEGSHGYSALAAEIRRGAAAVAGGVPQPRTSVVPQPPDPAPVPVSSGVEQGVLLSGPGVAVVEVVDEVTGEVYEQPAAGVSQAEIEHAGWSWSPLDKRWIRR